MTKFKITLEIDDSLYMKFIDGKKLLEEELREKYNKNIIVKDEYFLQWVISDYIQKQKDLPFFNDN